jgi:hypothetical protein
VSLVLFCDGRWYLSAFTLPKNRSRGVVPSTSPRLTVPSCPEGAQNIRRERCGTVFAGVASAGRLLWQMVDVPTAARAQPTRRSASSLGTFRLAGTGTWMGEA